MAVVTVIQDPVQGTSKCTWAVPTWQLSELTDVIHTIINRTQLTSIVSSFICTNKQHAQYYFFAEHLLYMRFDRPKSFKVINVCTTRKRIHVYYFLLTVNCEFSSVSRYSAAKSETNHPAYSLSPRSRDPIIHFECSRQTHPVASTFRLNVEALCYIFRRKPRDPHSSCNYFACVTDRRQTDVRHIVTIAKQ